ncbi:hypothetical protein [Candidatus Poriferisodalis sp.]|uniref:hypothetical protein n=1 Tax=Candidatus Poriferisodalis sp. TaxID=3101277 RepID=UPI003AF6DD80
MDPVVRHSARRHGISDEDMLHAYRNPMRAFRDEDDENFIMYIGGDRSGQPLEVGVVADEEGRETVVHAMPARPRYLE